MRINNNLILNNKHALKARFRYRGSKKTVVDLNNELMLGWKLSKAKVYPQVKTNNLRITRFSGVPKWKLLCKVKNSSEKKKRSFFSINKSFIKSSPSKTYIYGQNKNFSRFYGYRLGFKGRFSSFLARFNILRKKKSLVFGKKSFFTKLNYLGSVLNQTKIDFSIFQPKTTFSKLKIYTVYNRPKRKMFIKFKNIFKQDENFSKKILIEKKKEPLKNLIKRFKLKKKLKKFKKLNLK